jgi:hypothetical protein
MSRVLDIGKFDFFHLHHSIFHLIFISNLILVFLLLFVLDHFLNCFFLISSSNIWTFY